MPDPLAYDHSLDRFLGPVAQPDREDTGLGWRFRYVDQQFAPPEPEDAGDAPGLGPLVVRLERYPVVKRTERGEVVLDGRGRKHFILDGARKRLAHPTRELALESFLARKRRQAALYRSQLARAEKALRIAELGRFGEHIWTPFDDRVTVELGVDLAERLDDTHEVEAGRL